MITNVSPKLINNTPLSISLYSISKEEAHYHEGFLELLFCLKGSITMWVAYEKITLKEGDIISFDPHDIHALSCAGENLLVSFYLDLRSPIFAHANLPFVFFVCQRGVISKEKQEKTRELKSLLLTALYYHSFPSIVSYPDAVYQDLSKKIMDLMLTHFHFFDYVTYFANNPRKYTQEAKDRFERIMVYVNKHYKEKLTISQLCETEHLSPNYLSHFFKETSYLGFSHYVNFVRIYEAERLLLESQKTISHIAYEVGFSDPKFYYKVFKIWYGCTPLQHKKKHIVFQAETKKSTIYAPGSKIEQLEHYIAYYFALLQLPQEGDARAKELSPPWEFFLHS